MARHVSRGAKLFVWWAPCVKKHANRGGAFLGSAKRLQLVRSIPCRPRVLPIESDTACRPLLDVFSRPPKRISLLWPKACPVLSSGHSVFLPPGPLTGSRLLTFHSGLCPEAQLQSLPATCPRLSRDSTTDSSPFPLTFLTPSSWLPLARDTTHKTSPGQLPKASKAR